MKRLTRIVSLIAGMGLLAFVTATAISAEEAKTVEGKVFCKLEGTGSGCCIGKLEKAIGNIKGVKEVSIDAEAGKATIVIEKGAKVSVEDINKAVAEADKAHDHGFKVVEIKQAE